LISRSPIRASCPHAGVEWRRGLPALSDGVVRLRELRATDVPALLRHLNQPEVLLIVRRNACRYDGYT
jgi:hypothetical protein